MYCETKLVECQIFQVRFFKVMVSVNFGDEFMVYPTGKSHSDHDVNNLAIKWMTHMSFFYIEF